MTYELAASTWGTEEIEAIQRVIASNRFTMGPNVARSRRSSRPIMASATA